MRTELEEVRSPDAFSFEPESLFLGLRKEYFSDNQ